MRQNGQRRFSLLGANNEEAFCQQKSGQLPHSARNMHDAWPEWHKDARHFRISGAHEDAPRRRCIAGKATERCRKGTTMKARAWVCTKTRQAVQQPQMQNGHSQGNARPRRLPAAIAGRSGHTRLNNGLRTCWASAAEKNFSV
jgi:hypothetical protein